MIKQAGESRLCFFMKITKIILIILLFASNLYSQINREWVQRYNGTANSYDIVTNIIPDDSGNVFLYGTSFNTGTATDMTIIKYNPAGSIVWEKKLNFGENSYDQLKAVYKDSLNNSYICGQTNEGAGDNKIISLKIDGQGNLIWSKIFVKENYVNFTSNDIVVYANRIFVAGNGRNPAGYFEMVLVCYDLAGTFQWDRTYGSADNRVESVNVIANSTGRVHVGYNVTYPNNNTTYGSAVYDLNGNFVTQIGNVSYGRTIKVMTDNSKNLIRLATYIPMNFSNVDFRVSKYDSMSMNTSKWTRDFNGSGNHYDFPFDVCVDNQNNVLVTGSSRHGDTLGTEDIATLKYSPDGDLLWSRIYNSDSNGMDQGMSIAADAQGNVYVGGAADLGSIRLGYKILKYSPSGNLLWEDSYSYTHHPEDFVYTIKVNKQNDLFVTGISFNPGTDYDFATIKYSQNVGIENISENIPGKFYLEQNYPNPFNPVTNFGFSISSNVKRETSNVKLIVYDMLGKEVETLVNERLNAGTYKVQWDASNYTSGVYFYELTSENFRQTKKMLLIK